VDSGLRAGLKFHFTPDRRGEFPLAVAEIISQVRAIERLPQNWDGYDANQLDDRAVFAAFDIIVHADRLCDCPVMAIPLSNGGLGLRWNAEGSELEVDINPNGTCEATLESDSGEIELPENSTLADAKELVSRHAKLR
jgi:hypothetical protein